MQRWAGRSLLRIGPKNQSSASLLKALLIVCAAFLVFAVASISSSGERAHCAPFSELGFALGATAIRKSRHSSATLHPESSTFRNILDSAGPMIFAVGLDGRIQQANHSAVRVLGYGHQELLCLSNFGQILGPGETARLARKLRQDSPLGIMPCPAHRNDLHALVDVIAALPNGVSRRLEAQLRQKNGAPLPVIFEVSAFRDDSSYAHGIVIVALEKPRASNAALESSSPHRDPFQIGKTGGTDEDFIATVSHELRTPLTSIRGALGLLSSGAVGSVSEKADKLLRIALSNSERLVRLVNDILDLDRIQKGREPILFRPIELSNLVGQAIDGMLPVAQAAGVHLCHDTTKLEMTGDPDRLLQVLTNLLSNAVKFSPPHSTVSVRMHPRATGVILSVIDQGRGIPADMLESIFERFQQVDVSDSRQKGGTGLGLAICRTIVNHHGGRIWAERNPRQGATFRVFLPYQPSSAPSSEDSTA